MKDVWLESNYILFHLMMRIWRILFVLMQVFIKSFNLGYLGKVNYMMRMNLILGYLRFVWFLQVM